MLQLARLSTKVCAVIALAMFAAAALSVWGTPRWQAREAAPSLEATVPMAFGNWKAMPAAYAQVAVAQGVEAAFEQPYDQTVMRSYVNDRGDTVMLALAWGQRQRQDVKVHRPEVCYPAQGYPVLRHEPGVPISLAGREQPVPTVSLLTGSGHRLEAVRYWIRIGQDYGGDGLAARWYILREGLKGRIPDGILVRASQRIDSPEEALPAQATLETFLQDLTRALPSTTLALLVR